MKWDGEEKKIWAQPQRAGKALELFCHQNAPTLSLNRAFLPRSAF